MSPSNTAQAHHDYANMGTEVRSKADKRANESVNRERAESVWKLLAVAANAQCNIWRMKCSRYAVLCLLGIPMLWTLLALGIYGFVLLDRSVSALLLTPALPAWISPLVRGVVYFGVAASIIGIIWNTFVGKALCPEEDSNHR